MNQILNHPLLCYLNIFILTVKYLPIYDLLAVSNVIIDFNTLNMESYASEYEEINQYLNEEFKITKDKILEKYNSQNIKCQKK